MIIYYRATLCVSAVFAVIHGVCLSVGPSVALVYCIHTAEDIVKLLVLTGSPIILVFLTSSDGIKFLRLHPCALTTETFCLI